MDEADGKSQTSQEAQVKQDRSPDKTLYLQDCETMENEKEESSVLLMQTSKEPEGEVVNRKDEVETDGVPYDSGWAWIILCGCFVNYVVLAGYLKSLSLFYVELSELYQASASETALLFSIRAAVFSLSCPFVMNVAVGHLGVRKTVLIGATLMSLSGILSSLAKDLMLVVSLTSVLLGLGQSMLMSPGDVLIGTYFRKRRAIALSLAKCGSSVGNMAVPVLITFFLEEYGLSGAQLLMGGLCLHCLPAALLFRPTSFYSATTKLNNAVSAKKHSQPASDQSVVNPQVNASSSNVLSTTAALCSSEPELCAFDQKLLESDVSQLQTSRVSDSLQTGDGDMSGYGASQMQGLSVSDPLIVVASIESSSPSAVDRLVQRPRSTSVNDVSCKPSYRPDTECSSKPSIAGSLHITRPGSRVLKRIATCPKVVFFMLDFSLFRSPLFLLLLAYYTLFSCPNIIVSYLPALAVENNVSEHQVALLLAIIGGLDLVCRLSCALIVNSQAVKASKMIVVALLVQGVAVQFVSAMTSFEHFLALSVLLGLFGGVSNTLLSVLVLDFVGPDKMGKALGFVLLTMGAFTAALFPFLGFIRDLTGSYTAVYNITGSGALLGAGLLCCENWVRRLEEKRTKSADADTHVP